MNFTWLLELGKLISSGRKTGIFSTPLCKCKAITNSHVFVWDICGDEVIHITHCNLCTVLLSAPTDNFNDHQAYWSCLRTVSVWHNTYYVLLGFRPSETIEKSRHKSSTFFDNSVSGSVYTHLTNSEDR